MNRYRTAFTLVELLIVIVIIGILAAVSVGAISGVQTRAYNTSVVSDAKAMQKLVMMYKEIHGHYPLYAGTPGTTAGSLSQICLGGNFPTDARFAVNSCACTQWDNNVNIECNGGTTTTDLTAALQGVGKVPDTSKYSHLSAAGDYWRGMMYSVGEEPPASNPGWNEGDPTIEHARIWYNLRGDNQACTAGEAGGYTADIPAMGEFPGGITSCMIVLSAS